MTDERISQSDLEDAYAATGYPLFSMSCYICKRILGENDADWVNVDFGLHIERVCDICMSKADTNEYLSEVLDNAD